jgi:hypothetical protein
LIAEATGKSLEEVRDFDLDDFNTWLKFFEVNPPLRELINLSQANISYTIAAVAPRGRGKRATPFKEFRFDFKRAQMSDREKIADDVRKFFKKK